MMSGFNPSIGILVVQTVIVIVNEGANTVFQSLNRDSGCSDLSAVTDQRRAQLVSIPQSGFWLFRLGSGRVSSQI